MTLMSALLAPITSPLPTAAAEIATGTSYLQYAIYALPSCHGRETSPVLYSVQTKCRDIGKTEERHKYKEVCFVNITAVGQTAEDEAVFYMYVPVEGGSRCCTYLALTAQVGLRSTAAISTCQMDAVIRLYISVTRYLSVDYPACMRTCYSYNTEYSVSSRDNAHALALRRSKNTSWSTCLSCR